MKIDTFVARLVQTRTLLAIGAVVTVYNLVQIAVTPDKEVEAWKYRRASWHLRCDQYRGQDISDNPEGQRCHRDLQDLLADARRLGWDGSGS